MRKLIPISVVLLILFGAFQTPTVTPLVKQELNELIQAYRDDQWEQCNKRALEKAAYEVDSLIIIWAKANRDTLNRPLKPIKPEEPPRLAPKDTTLVKPLFDSPGD